VTFFPGLRECNMPFFLSLRDCSMPFFPSLRYGGIHFVPRHNLLRIPARDDKCIPFQPLGGESVIRDCQTGRERL
jgi:hypothetical protein